VAAIVKSISWTRQPPRPVAINRANKFGRQVVWAMVPAWGPGLNNDTSVNHGTIATQGQVQIFEADLTNSVQITLDIVADNYPKSIGMARVLRLTPEDSARFGRLIRADADTGIQFPNIGDFCLAVVIRPSGNGAITASDPRIYSKDQGSAANDHDLMVGSVNAGFARTRIRIGSATVTVVNSGTTLQSDALNLISGGVTGNTVTIRHIREDGQEVTNSGSGTGSYNPRTTTSIAVGANAEVDQNPIDADIIQVVAFDHNSDFPELQEYFNNIWQIWALQQRVYFEPVEPPVGGRIMSSLARYGGFAHKGGIAGSKGGLAA